MDKFPEIPTYLEIEYPNIRELKKYLRLLGFSMNDTKPWSAKDVLEHYGKLDKGSKY